MQTITLQAVKRTLSGRKTFKLRSQGQVPAILYGVGTEPVSISLDRKALISAFRESGESTLVDLSIENTSPIKVLIQDLQYDPLRHELIHADFRSVDLSKTVRAEIKLHFVGEAPAVKALAGILVHAADSIEVEAFPQALVSSIDVDISVLQTFDDVIHLSDIKFPEGIKPVDELETTIAVVTPPRSEAELADLNKTVDVDVTAVEVAKREKKEEEPAEEKK
ncbi:MAG: 50S ribosomal protein L25 [Candidatus Uhrbacteria bacterium GW2011_GWF2_41_16]|jgi:large subunit ribosomal protein L25|uniref:Large ribosomal subunit protein bL25 n=2 Tax=Candidatus Uhriibacteriota TaxID=1752732 RepID=A0A0G0XPK8_9BACT|nr:MAG: 50S ribosomal protein L25 [Candidatus Uhrbacteria bacterium GW2011_GWA2_41_10]KKR87801.1 MAG: 50S ribosomal protein L25 [Candidatus Uhrbacteria bacterium GW2011_GWC2_41_11]KKR98740.1 MAG: 50S ribosomal protein L25 [Candidatus Uhrbacteria bacterium GW2011_GWF2_41_16]HBP00163.1 50S ribosomal protein L25 [Candidatus Uhrbacteria bacterium]